MGLIDERSNAILRHVLEGEYETTSSSSFSPSVLDSTVADLDKANFNKLRDGYLACMNEELIAKRGLEPLLKFVTELKDVYPLHPSKDTLKKPEDPIEGLTDAITYMQELGLAGFIDFGISV